MTPYNAHTVAMTGEGGTIHCPECGRAFRPAQGGQRFCRAVCRRDWHLRWRHRAMELLDLATTAARGRWNPLCAAKFLRKARAAVERWGREDRRRMED